MYLRKLRVRNIKCFGSIDLDFVDEAGAIRRWTTLLGQNGCGKSTLLQAMAVALAGPGATRELMPVADGWTRRGSSFGEIEAELGWSEGDSQLSQWPKKTPYNCMFVVTGDDPDAAPAEIREQSLVPSIVEWTGNATARAKEELGKHLSRLKKTAWAEGKPGWLACGYGPFRRLSGGHQEADKILYSGRKSARFLTLFREDAALTNATSWLTQLYNTGRDGDSASNKALDQVRSALADGFLPEKSSLLVDARAARLKIGTRAAIPFQHLSDGYRSMLALGLDLLRRLIDAFPETLAPTSEPGVVLIDELDAHLHPIWQQQIGEWLQDKFPNLQFVIATHSPFLAQVASDARGNIVLLQDEQGDVSVRTDSVAVGAWRSDQILTELFGLASTRSPSAQSRLSQFLALDQKRRRSNLSVEEESSLQQLELFYSTVPPAVENPIERRVAEVIQNAITSNADALKRVT